MASIFENVEQAPPIEVFLLGKLYLEDSFDKKVNLGAGAYRDSEGKPWVLPVVRKTEIAITQNEEINHEYLPVSGQDVFTKAATKLLLGADSEAIKENRAFGIQSLSGTGALTIGSCFLAKSLNRTTFYYSNPTWENHRKVFLDAGFKNANTYRYWDAVKRELDFAGLIEDLENAPEGSVIILHACAHNPTGMDPTQEQWKQIAEVMKSKKLFPFFDSAYQGFASGDPVKDAWAVRYFVSQGFELFCAQSFAKNFGLYCERAGNLTIVQASGKTQAAILSHISLIIRGSYSNPPAFGSRIVSTILNDEALLAEWSECIKIMSKRIIDMRAKLYAELVKLETPGNWEHIVKQIGMFSYTGLNENQSKYLVKEFHIYLLNTGRISMCGLNDSNVAYVAKAIHHAITTIN
jgi:aspartate aminotransferase